TESPARMFDVLRQAGALERVMPGLLFDDEIAGQLNCAVRTGLSLPQRFALLCRKTPDPELIGRHLRAPTECIDYARLLPGLVQSLNEISKETDGGASDAQGPGPEFWLNTIERHDGLRKPE